MQTRRHFILRGTICALALFSLLSHPLSAFAGDSLSVQVICKPGVGVANAQVKLYRVSATDQSTTLARQDRTNTKGLVDINNLAGGAYELVVVCPGGETFTHQFRIGGGVDESHSFLFRCCPWPPGAPPPGGDGLIGIDGTPVTPDVTANSRAMPAKVATANGLSTVTFDTLQGQVIVKLPDDIRAGDTISGTVIAEPKGNTEPERAKNLADMDYFHINATTSYGEGSTLVHVESVKPFTIKLPPNPTLTNVSSANSGGLGITLTNTSGSLTTSPTQTVPIQMVSLSLQSVVPITVQLPTMGQQGRPIEIFGPFDGNSANTSLNWTRPRSAVQDFEKNTENVSGGFGLLAESPRKCVFQAPANVTGPIEITLKEGNKETKGTFRNVGVNLSAPKTNLLKGEHTTLTVQVSGLEGLKEPVPLTLESRGVITMEGGMFQPLFIQPSQVGADGRYTTTRGITGVQAGAWESTATVVTQPFNIVLRDPTPPQTILVNSFTGDYAFCGGGTKLSGTGEIKRKGCVVTLTDNKPDRQVQGTFDGCTPVNNGGFTYSPGLNTNILVTVIDTNPKKTKVYFNLPSTPRPPPVQDVSAFATCP